MRRLSEVLKEEYGEKIYRLTLSSGCTCPNRDGSLSYGGCTFCSEGGSGEFAADYASVEQQINEAKKRIAGKTDAKKFIAYFQSFTNTYGDVQRLSKLYEETIRRDDIVILSLGTRPDCLGEDVLEMLRNLNQIKPVWVELGLQTIQEKTAERINRQYPLSVFEDAYQRLKAEKITVIVHVIFGLPGENREDMLQTIQYLSELEPELDGIKIQMLNILKGTKMSEEYLQNPFPLFSLEEYASLVKESIRILPENIVIHRMSGDGPGSLLIEPKWIRNKKKVLNTINRAIAQLP